MQVMQPLKKRCNIHVSRITILAKDFNIKKKMYENKRQYNYISWKLHYYIILYYNIIYYILFGVI